MKSTKRSNTQGTMDRIGGRLMEMIGKVTGRTSARATGRAARVRGGGRRQTVKVRRKATR